jgi:hypothetical protein
MGQEWTIYPNGQIIGSAGQELQASPEKVIALLAKLEEIKSSAKNEAFVYEESCCDQFTYTVVYQAGDQEILIQTSDGSDHPGEISAILTDLRRLISQADPVE